MTLHVSGEKVVLGVPVSLPLSVISQDLGISDWASAFSAPLHGTATALEGAQPLT